MPRDTPADVLTFWQDAGRRGQWFDKDPAFDRRFRERFLDLHEAASRGECDDWAATPDGVLALLVLLDQFPRNAFRGTPRMYATDAMARDIAGRAMARGLDAGMDPSLLLFLGLPFAHSESLLDQERSVKWNRKLGRPWLDHALDHQAIIRRFGRFPHRNAILGRRTTPAEQDFLDAGGFAG